MRTGWVGLFLAIAGYAWADRYPYEPVDLKTLGGVESKAFAINTRGDVVGYSAISELNYRAFVWDGRMTELPPLDGFIESAAFGINDSAEVVGSSYNHGDPTVQATRWTFGVPTYLGAFEARAINNNGHVAGHLVVQTADEIWVSRACVHRQTGLTELGGADGSDSFAHGINDSGVVVGAVYGPSDTGLHAVMWQAGAQIGLSGLPAFAMSVNAAGQIVGATTVSSLYIGTVFDVTGSGITMTELGNIGTESVAYGINNHGQIVGTSGVAFLWESGEIKDLNALVPSDSGWRLDTATAINDRGRIVGYGAYHGEPHAFLLIPIAAGDANRDGCVDDTDVALILLDFGAPGGEVSGASDTDTNSDGIVDDADITIAILNFNSGC